LKCGVRCQQLVGQMIAVVLIERLQCDEAMVGQFDDDRLA
jgi:hypothetical protein